ncbi:coenzyme F420-0:L-glutamate ligase [uncultured Methanobrevibacter sp.]|uniref:coenzyme F420-0:L-glutamate ligase n=1 Tax=uncultured Methanobrevibacter sp. TaxID=253161 RepID=UPI0034362649
MGSIISEEEYKETFGSWIHPFTGINMIDFYRELIESEDCEVEFVFSNDIKTILDYTTDVLTCDIHTREKTTKLLKSKGANVYGLHQILVEPIGDSGSNPDYGLLGSNKATEEKLKLFPKTGDKLVNEVQKRLIELTGKQIEVMVYGDGAFKDPVGKIWELADPVVSPAHTAGLVGYPNEIKLKYVSDNKFANLKGDELKEAIKEEIRQKAENLTGQMITEGTTPRVLTDLIGSLCDLTSGSGDKGTPVVFIQGYFDNLAND